MSKRYLVFPIDIGFMIISFSLAYLIRFEDYTIFITNAEFWKILAIVVFFRSIVFAFSEIYKSLWSYASIHDLMEIIKTTLLSSLVSTTAVLFYNNFHQQSRMIPILDTLLLLSFLCLRSFSWRLFRDQYLSTSPIPKKATLLIGAGSRGATLLSELRRNQDILLSPVALLDPDPGLTGMNIMGVPVVGTIEDIDSYIHSLNIQSIIITLPNPEAGLISKLIKISESNSIDLKILPSFGDLFLKKAEVSQIREIRVEDLLGRPVVKLEVDEISSYLKGKTILITGAGGSIGGELCRQVALFSPSKLVILDSAETPLYEIDYEIKHSFPSMEVIPVIGDVKNLSRLSIIFNEYKPDVVFHSAAYKHVPMMEINPAEAVLNNIQGTKNVADISRLAGVERFVLISTDKAVNPVNIMGASKRTSELYIQHISPNSRTKFITVRFGNVLGSNGSVIPRFRDQIKNGGPVTVTHPDVIRYFMTIPEAAQLVLQAGSMGQRGEIFILDMGEAVRIVDLAEEMIRLSGLKPYIDIDIIFTGLRSGEKLFEELLLDMEGIKKTHHPKIRIAEHQEMEDPIIFQNKLNKLFNFAREGKTKEIFNLFKEIVPEYKIHKDYIVNSEVNHEKKGSEEIRRS